MFESSQNVLLKPTETWRETLLDSRVMELFFTVSLSFHFCHQSHGKEEMPLCFSPLQPSLLLSLSA
jgi:hypothetical protein